MAVTDPAGQLPPPPASHDAITSAVQFKSPSSPTAVLSRKPHAGRIHPLLPDQPQDTLPLPADTGLTTLALPFPPTPPLPPLASIQQLRVNTHGHPAACPYPTTAR